MRLYELTQVQRLTEEELNEFNLKKLAANTALAAAMTMPTAMHKDKDVYPTKKEIQAHMMKKSAENKVDKISAKISKKYKVPQKFAKKVVTLATKHADPVFPKAEDLIALIGVESNFNPNAVSGLKKDPAVGLTQIRPGVWNMDKEKLQSDIEHQIVTAANILKDYHTRLGNKDAALAAYNVGIGSYRNGQINPRYVPKIKAELSSLTDI